MKSTRANPTAPVPYQGPTCKIAGVTPARIYDERELAQADADRLSQCNGAGFVVLPFTA